jgi:hypothetical protein
MFGRDMIHNICLQSKWEANTNQKVTKTLSTSPIKSKFEQESNCLGTISCNECIQEWYNQNPKGQK